jgi:lipid A 4'-phosphatase
VIGRDAAHTALTASALGFCLSAFLFGAWPGLDIAVSGAFLTDAGEFSASTNRWLEILRHALWDTTTILVVFSITMVTVQLVFRPKHRVSTRVWGFIILSFVLGPGLIVNGLLKNHWGRARPRDIEIFGGNAQFTDALTSAHECLKNCSFVSGEASGFFTFALVLSLTFVPAIRQPASRYAALAGLWCLALLAGGLRIAVGAHFLSDVVFAFFTSAIVTLSLYLAMSMERRVVDATVSNAALDVQSIMRPVVTFIRRGAKQIAGRSSAGR